MVMSLVYNKPGTIVEDLEKGFISGICGLFAESIEDSPVRLNQVPLKLLLGINFGIRKSVNLTIDNGGHCGRKAAWS